MSILVESLKKSGATKYAQMVSHKMPKDILTWNSQIGACVKNARYNEALKIFRTMLNSNVQPDGYTFASVISGCAHLGSLNLAQWVHGLMIEKRIKLNYILSSGLIDMYSKCGRIQTARELFSHVPHNEVSVWNAMINGLAVHGLALEAIEVFSKMEVENVPPDLITFIGILTACSHCGLVEEGRQFFNLMRFRYSIRPELEHFGAMVDLFCRAGRLKEAHALIKDMPMEPDIVIWRSFLSACRIYKNQELGESAISNISDPKGGNYVLLSNIYCSLERWDRSEKVREMMRKNGIHKNSGKSWVELGSAVHSFRAGESSHSESNAIYKVLKRLLHLTRVMGYTPMTELVFMDVSEEEKEENLSLHSEKLALAYGILKTCPGTEIRILKNLRICNDCHCWMKMVSTIIGRVIIMRDRIRFHRFEGGLCSCRDNW